MKKFLLPLLLFPIVAISQNNDSAENPFYAETKIVCVTQEILFPTINSYGEQPMLSLNSKRITPVGQEQQNSQYPSILFANPSTGTWTLVERHGENVFCVVGVGEGLKPHR